MRILFVSSVADAEGGAEQSLLELARALRDRGHDVALAAWAPGTLTAAFDPLGPTFTLGMGRDPASPLGGATTRIPVLRPLVRLANRARLALRPVAREARWLASAGREADADLLHTNCDISPPVARRAARSLGTPWVAHVRDRTRSWLHPRTAAALREAALVMVPSEFLAGPLRDRGVDPAIVPNPLSDAELPGAMEPDERARLRAELGADEGDFLVGVIGRLDEQKGTLDVVEAARRLDEMSEAGTGETQTPADRIRFVLAGAGRPAFESRLRRAMETTGTGDRIRLLGHRADVPRWLPALDAVAVPSRSEGFGRVIVEGMQAGRPVVAFDDGAAPELLEDGVTGVLVPAGEVGALVDELRTLAKDPDRCGRLGDAARAATGRYAPDAVAGRVEALYHRLLED